MEENSLLLEIVSITKEILTNSKKLQEDIIKRLDCLEKTVAQNTITFNQRLDGIETNLSKRIDEVETNLSKRIDEVETNLSKRIDNVEANLSKRIDNVEANLSKRIDNVEANLSKRIDNVEKRLDHIEKDHGKRLENIENTVARIEKEHGEKIQVLFDYFVNQDLKYQKTNTQIQKIQKELDSHDSRIFALEFYKKEKLNSK